MAAPAHAFPRAWPTSRWLGRLLLKLVGWRVEGAPPPDVAKAVVIACPHTSNWDYVAALIVGWSLGLSFHWLGKDALFRPPWGWLLRLLGGVAVDRSAPQGLVGQVAAALRNHDRMMLMVPAEGTRGYRPYWKSGFWFIAREAHVPIVLGYLDYPRRRAGFGPLVWPSGSPAEDMDVIRAFYADKEGLYPEAKSRIRLRMEDGEEAGPG